MNSKAPLIIYLGLAKENWTLDQVRPSLHLSELTKRLYEMKTDTNGRGKVAYFFVGAAS